MNQYYAYIPSNLNIEELLKNNPPINMNVIKPDSIALVLNNWYSAASTNLKNFNNSGFINLSSRILHKYEQNYSHVINYLVESNVMATDNIYIKGEKCRGYTITNTYATEIKRYNYKSDKFKISLSRKILNHKNGKKDEKTELVRNVHKNLEKWINPKYIYFNAEKAQHILETYYKDTLINGKSNAEKLIYPIYQTALEKLKNFEILMGVDNKSGRFHSSLTNLKKTFKTCITYKNEKLYQIDITNAQPFFGQILFKKEFWNNKIERLSYVKRLGIEKNNYLMFLEKLKTLDTIDIESYISSVNAGSFYEDFLKVISSDEPNLSFDRSGCKTAMYQAFFSSNSWLKRNDYYCPKKKKLFKNAIPKLLFKQCYPNVYSMFAKIKSKKDHKSDLAIILQNIESYLILECCCRRISKERPKCPIYTIHDSISTTIEHVDYVKIVMEEEISGFIGVVPKLEITSWDTPYEELINKSK